jgi:hypothetical protein
MPSAPVTDPEILARLQASAENARRCRRFKAALLRARKIVAAEPPLTPEQLAELAEIFRPDAS